MEQEKTTYYVVRSPATSTAISVVSSTDSENLEDKINQPSEPAFFFTTWQDAKTFLMKEAVKRLRAANAETYRATQHLEDVEKLTDPTMNK